MREIFINFFIKNDGYDDAESKFTSLYSINAESKKEFKKELEFAKDDGMKSPSVKLIKEGGAKKLDALYKLMKTSKC